MARKYDLIDEQLLQWLKDNPNRATTAAAIDALCVTNETIQRHISRRFSLLEDKGALVCSLEGTTRVCRVVRERLPETLYKSPTNAKAWRNTIRDHVDQIVGRVSKSTTPSIPATCSREYEAAGGKVERLPSRWDETPARKQLGPTNLFDALSELD